MRPVGWEWWEEELEHINPELHLGWDRKLGYYCLYRMDRELKWVDGSDLGIENFGYYHRVPTIVQYLWWRYEQPGRDLLILRRPDRGILRSVAEEQREKWAYDNAQWVMEQHRKAGKAEEAKADREIQSHVSDVTHEMMMHCDPSRDDLRKIRVAVP